MGLLRSDVCGACDGEEQSLMVEKIMRVGTSVRRRQNPGHFRGGKTHLLISAIFLFYLKQAVFP